MRLFKPERVKNFTVPRKKSEEAKYRIDALYSVFVLQIFPIDIVSFTDYFRALALTFSQDNIFVETGFFINENMSEKKIWRKRVSFIEKFYIIYSFYP